ncbi:unnamed protein product [Caenorhabditis sp. 36 PRJEB53466]|nr:unnamed protein product [Caenorhabditis sp. 36 PRJEB53466]
MALLNLLDESSFEYVSDSGDERIESEDSVLLEEADLFDVPVFIVPSRNVSVTTKLKLLFFYSLIALSVVDLFIQISESMARTKTQVPIQQAIVGGWRMVSSKNLDEFYQKCKFGSEIDNLVDQMGDKFYEFNGNEVTMYTKLAGKTYQREVMVLGERKLYKPYYEKVEIENNCLHFVYVDISDGEEYMRQEECVVDGQLQAVTKRFGINTVRIYKRLDAHGKTDVAKTALEKTLQAEVEWLRSEMITIMVRKMKQ